MSRFSYVEAIAQFERALRDGCAAKDEVWLCDKIGDALLRGARPDLATPWFERAVAQCEKADLPAKRRRLLRGLPHQLWLASRTADAYESALHAKQTALVEGDNATARVVSVSIAGWLARLGRYDEARRSFECAGRQSEISELPRHQIYTQLIRAIMPATRGQASVAFKEFDRAIDLAKALPDGHAVTFVWDDYANWATALGRLDIARACRERALLVARERRVIWRIPYLTLRFAAMLVMMGNYDDARDLVLDALTYDLATPVIHVLSATVGSEVAFIFGDQALLKHAMKSDALEFAFQSQEPERIAPIVATYAKIRVSLGQFRSAKALISRGVQAVNQADHAGDLLTLAARYGTSADASRAHGLLLERMKLPHHRVAQAYLKLWEAYNGQRRRAGTEAVERAREAAQLFARLGRKHQQMEALALTGDSEPDSPQSKPMASYLGPTLTNRERQVAELILRGLSNRAIAQTLKISEHTVETHVTSILNRLGLRSRWQLADHAIA